MSTDLARDGLDAGVVRPALRARRRFGPWPWLAGALVVLAGAAAVVWRGAGGGKPLDPTLVSVARRADLAIDVIETGKVQPRDKVEVKSKVAGQVARVLVEEGQRVRRGQLLLALDPTDFHREVARAAAEVARATAEESNARNALAFARLSLSRRLRGLEGRGVAQIDVDVAESEVRARAATVGTAHAILAGARVALAAAQDRLRYTRIIAPMDGTVIARGIEPGEVITPGVQATFEGKALLTIADLSALVVKTDLNQIDVARVKLGQEVTLALDALPGRKYRARISKIAPASTVPKGKDVDVFPIEAALTDADAEIKPGMTADVRVHVDVKKQVVTLPIEAIVKEAGKTFVNKVVPAARKGERTEKTEVQTGARNDRDIEVTGGVGVGERVLIKPASSSENEYK